MRRAASRLWAVLREACAAALGTPVASVLTVAMIAGMCSAVLLTTGRTQAAEAAALAQIDAAGTRSLIVRAQEDAGLTADVVGRLRTIDAVEQVTAFGPVTDVRNGAVPSAPPLGVRPTYGDLPAVAPVPGAVYVSEAAAEQLGLVDGTGDIATSDGIHLTVAGDLSVPDHLTFLEPLAAMATGTQEARTRAGPVTLVAVLVEEPHLVAAVTDAVGGLLAVDDPTKITIETSERLAEVRAAVHGQLGTYGRDTVIGILGVAALLVAANLFALVMMRRRDFGRRRALGASQALIVGLLLAQTAALAVLGAVVGSAATIASLAVSGSPAPDLEFTLAVAVASVLTAVVAALLPSVAAARREPLYELRVA